MRKFAPLLLFLCLTWPVASARACTIVDATGAFWPLVERSDAMSPEAQAAAFRADVVAKFPQLYTDDVLDARNIKNLDRLAAAWIAITRKNGLKGRAVEQENDAPNVPLYAEYFEGGSAKAKAEGIPSRAGYELAHLSGEPLHTELNRAPDALAAGGP